MATATKKQAAGPAKAKNAVVKWDAALAERARKSQKVASNLGTGGNWVSIKGAVMKYKGNPVEGNAMNVMVPSFVLENQYYGRDYDPDTPQSPVCYAFGDDQATMRPHEKSPQKQHNQCKGCPQNEWGTAERGRGKACKNVVRLGLLPADALERGGQGVRDAEEAIIKVPVTSCKAWGGFVSQLEAIDRPPLSFITEISITPDPKTQVAMHFKAVEEITDGDAIEALLERADQMDKTLPQPYPDFEENAAGAAANRGGTRRPGQAARAPAKAASPGARRAMAEAAAKPGQAKARKF